MSEKADLWWESQPPLLDVDTAARIIGRTAATVRRALNLHQLGGFRIAGQWYIAQKDLLGFISDIPRHKKAASAFLPTSLPVRTEADNVAWDRTLPAHMTAAEAAKLLHLPERSLIHSLAVGGALPPHTDGGAPQWLEVSPDGIVARDALIKFLTLCANSGPRYV